MPLAELLLPLHASQNICNLVISQQNRRYAYNNYGRFHNVSETRDILTNKSKASMNLLILNSLRSSELIYSLLRQADAGNLRICTTSEACYLRCIFEHATVIMLK